MLWTMVFILLRWQTFPGLTTVGWPWSVTVTDLYWWGLWQDRCTGPPCSTWTRPLLPVGYGPLMTNRWALPPPPPPTPTPPSTLTCTQKMMSNRCDFLHPLLTPTSLDVYNSSLPDVCFVISSCMVTNHWAFLFPTTSKSETKVSTNLPYLCSSLFTKRVVLILPPLHT